MERSTVIALEFRANCQIEPRLSLLGTKPDAGKGYGMSKSKTVIGLTQNTQGYLELSLSTVNSLNGRRFLVRDMDHIVANFVREGKITFQMRRPYVDIMISGAGPQELRTLMNAIQQESSDRNELAKSSLTNVEQQKAQKRQRVESRLNHEASSGTSTCGVQAKAKQIRLDFTQTQKTEQSDAVRIKRLLNSRCNPSTVLRAVERDQYPKGGLSSSLVHIQTVGIGMRQIDSRMLSLQHLQFLDLSNNRITSIESLKLLNSHLAHLVLDGNPLQTISKDLFLAPALSSLSFLSLKDTQLKVIPRSILKLEKLLRLYLNQNQIQILPYNMTLLLSLKYLDLQDNLLSFLPFPVSLLRLLKLDVSKNQFVEPGPALDEAHRRVGTEPFPTLLELAAEAIKTHNALMISRKRQNKLISATPTDIPACLYDFLEEMKCCSRCGRMVGRYVVQNVAITLRGVAQELTVDTNPVLAKKVICLQCVELGSAAVRVVRVFLSIY